MNITFLGAGAVGSYFAGRMIEAGHNVSLIARGQRLHQLNYAGLEVVSPTGNIARSVAATDNSDELPPADIIIVTVKNYSLEAACKQHFDYIKRCGYVLTLQNGIDAPQIVSGMFPDTYVLAGQAYISANILNDGKVIHSGEHAAINYGAFNNRLNLTNSLILEDVRGIHFSNSDNIYADLWKKLSFISVLSGLTGLTRQSIGTIRANPDLWLTFKSALRESCTVAEADCVRMRCRFAYDSVFDAHIKFAESLPQESFSSLYYDLIQGRPLELDWLSGAIVRHGRQLNIATPIHEMTITEILQSLQGRGS